jgi:hypothetical protein
MAEKLVEHDDAYVRTKNGNYSGVHAVVYRNWVRIRTSDRVRFVPTTEVVEVSYDD